jgi:hypothetical protein
MLEKIDEPVSVTVSFAGRQVRPLAFRWHGRLYQDLSVNLVHQERDGSDRVFYFNLSDANNYFRLAFFTRDLTWRILELYYPD